MSCVLFVEDEGWKVAPLIQRMEADGHRVLSASSAQDALTELSGADVDLVVLDVMIPSAPMLDVLDKAALTGIHPVKDELLQPFRPGIDLYRSIRNRFPSVSIIILSDLDETEIRRRAPDIKFDCAFLLKSLHDNAARLEAIQKVLNRSN